jgi:hypothetical protein
MVPVVSKVLTAFIFKDHGNEKLFSDSSTLEDQSIMVFETSGTSNPATYLDNSEHLNPLV